jgi:hypothetical protein
MIVETEYFSAHCGLCIPLFLVTSSSTVVVVVGVVDGSHEVGSHNQCMNWQKWR